MLGPRGAEPLPERGRPDPSRRSTQLPGSQLPGGVQRLPGGSVGGPAPGAHPASSLQGAALPESSLVRPYAVTGGRTQPRRKLNIEAMVAASHYEAHDLSVLSPECQQILGFCRDWRSVAEISAVLHMPLGVARVLVADMAVEGLVRVHQIDHAQGRPDLKLLERVLSGLRKL